MSKSRSTDDAAAVKPFFDGLREFERFAIPRKVKEVKDGQEHARKQKVRWRHEISPVVEIGIFEATVNAIILPIWGDFTITTLTSGTG